MPSGKPQQALQLGLNVLIDNSCEGCNWHEYPYEFNCILLNSKNKQVRVNGIKDVWIYVEKLVKELNEVSKKGKQFKILLSIFEQLPFFVCSNQILDAKCQKDIGKYIYCKDTGTISYDGCYGEQPGLWLEKYYIIKDALNQRDKMLRKQAERKNKNEG